MQIEIGRLGPNGGEYGADTLLNAVLELSRDKAIASSSQENFVKKLNKSRAMWLVASDQRVLPSGG